MNLGVSLCAHTPVLRPVLSHAHQGSTASLTRLLPTVTYFKDSLLLRLLHGLLFFKMKKKKRLMYLFVHFTCTSACAPCVYIQCPQEWGGCVRLLGAEDWTVGRNLICWTASPARPVICSYADLSYSIAQSRQISSWNYFCVSSGVSPCSPVWPRAHWYTLDIQIRVTPLTFKAIKHLELKFSKIWVKSCEIK